MGAARDSRAKQLGAPPKSQESGAFLQVSATHASSAPVLLTFPLVTPQGEHPLARGLRLKNLGTCQAIEAVKKEKFQEPLLAGLFMLGFLKEPFGRN